MGAYLKPLPDISDENRPFWDGLRQGQFLVTRCNECGDYSWPPYPACRSCLSENLRWEKVSGEGEIYSYTVVHRGPGVFQEEVPYVIALVKLREQPRPLLVMGNVIGTPIDDIRIGQKVRMGFASVPDEDVTLWQFTVEEISESSGE